MKKRITSFILVLLAALVAVAGLGGCGGSSSSGPWSSAGIVWNEPYGYGWEWLAYKKVGNTVYLKGAARAMDPDADPSMQYVQEGQVVCTLPEGFRPPVADAATLLAPTWGWPTGNVLDGFVGTAGIIIYSNGRVLIKTVQQFNGEQEFINFDGLYFSTVSGEGGWSSEGFTWTAPYASSGYFPSSLQYIKTGTNVMLQGSANAGDTCVQEGQVIGTLPEGFRPPAEHSVFLLCPTWGWPTGHSEGYIGTAGVLIGSDGTMEIKTVQQFDGEQQYLMFDGLSFSTVIGTDGWSNEGIAWETPYTLSSPYPSTLEVKLDADMVLMRGFGNAGSTYVWEGQTVGTLPAGFRSPQGYSRTLLCPTWGWPPGHTDGYIGTAGVSIFADGTINVETVQQFDGQQQFLMLDGKQFSTVD